VALQDAQDRPLRLHDLAVADDFLLDVRDIADDLFRAALEDVVLERVELVADLVEDREAVVEEIVEHLIEEPAEPFEKRSSRNASSSSQRLKSRETGSNSTVGSVTR